MNSGVIVDCPDQGSYEKKDLLASVTDTSTTMRKSSLQAREELIFIDCLNPVFHKLICLI